MFYISMYCFSTPFTIGSWQFAYKNWIISREMPKLLYAKKMMIKAPRKVWFNLTEK